MDHGCFAIQSTVFDVTDDAPRMVGIVSAKTKIAYEVAPGEHHFMVVSEAADFMRADLAAGKTYYALVTPRMGVWRARFSLLPPNRNMNAARRVMRPVRSRPARSWSTYWAKSENPPT